MNIKKTIITFILFLCLFSPSKVKASEYEEYITLEETNTHFKVETVDNQSFTFQGEFLTRASDGQWVYSLNPQTSVRKKLFYGYEENNLISENVWNKIILLAYYGYNYLNHNDLHWYFVTQLLIWKEVNPEWNIYFIDQRFKKDITYTYESEIQELYNLVDHHNTIPLFDKYNYQVSINESANLIDQKNILNKFDVNIPDKIGIVIKENNITINPLDFGNYEIKFYKNFDNYQDSPILYVNGPNLVMAVGKLPDVSTKINLNIHAGKISIQSNKPNNIYQTFDEENYLIEEITTDENGFAESNYMPKYGRYYLLDQNEQKYHFEINADNLNQLVVINTNEEEEEYIQPVQEEKKVEIISPEQNEIKEETKEKKKNDIEYIEIKVPVTGKNIFKTYKYQKYFITKYYEKKKKY